MVTMTSNSGVGVSSKKIVENMANDLLAVNISGSPADGRQRKNIFFLLRSLPYIVKAWGDLPEILLFPW